MKITVIGCGYVGLVTGACLASLGNTVMCLDVDEPKVRDLNRGIIPIYEPGLEDLVRESLRNGTLVFTTDSKIAIEHGDMIFIAVGTPAKDSGEADLQYVMDAAKTIGLYMDRDKLVVNKSTVPPGTAARVDELIWVELRERDIVGHKITVISNPEFLKEGAAIFDFMKPDRIVIGCSPDNVHYVKEVMDELYAPINRNHYRTIYMDTKSAEFTKYASNAMLATRISFMNEMACLAEDIGVDIEAVRSGVGSDSRIGRDFLYPGIGYGGSCFPKDVSALIDLGNKRWLKMNILEAVQQVNTSQKEALFKYVITKFGADLKGLKFAVWGLAFKPGTDDVREAPSLVTINALIKNGAQVQVYDPAAMLNFHAAIFKSGSDPDFTKITYASSAADALKGCDALLILTEWPKFKTPDFEVIKSTLKQPLIFDGRNIYDPKVMTSHDIEYWSIGRPVVERKSE